jgi:IS30 family transposase
MPKTYIQITLSERRSIEQMLARRLTVSAMAGELKRSPQSISRELKRNRIPQTKQYIHQMARIPNNCMHRRSCEINNVCGKACIMPGVQCRKCYRCNEVCENFLNDPCPTRRDKAPWVCNSCPDSNSCTRKKYYYRANAAHKLSEERKIESRSGITLTESEIAELNDIFSDRIKKGQSIHSIYRSEIDRMPCCEKSIYSLLDSGLFDAKNLDLRLKVRRRPSKKKRTGFKVDKQCHLGRTYADFESYLQEHPFLTEVQMDTVLGPRGTGKAMLTLYWKQANFLLVFLLPQRRSIHVIERFGWLRQRLGEKRFKLLFPLLLTDRGSEFSNPIKIESTDNEVWTHIFYCDPNNPQQKGALEQEHSMIRQIIPKNKCFDHLKQEDISLMNSHITSYARPGLGDKNPQEIFSFLFGDDLMDILELERIKPEEVILNKTLLAGFTTPTLSEEYNIHLK